MRREVESVTKSAQLSTVSKIEGKRANGEMRGQTGKWVKGEMGKKGRNVFAVSPFFMSAVSRFAVSLFLSGG